MPLLNLSPAERKAHRAAAHHLHPVVMVGNDGLSPAVVKEASAALNAHGLIKIRVLSDDRAFRESLFVQLCDELGAAPVQHIGKLLVLWRPQPQRSAGAPDDETRKPGPRVVKVVKPSKSGNHRPVVKKIKLMGNQRVTAGGTVKRAKSRTISVKKKQATD